MERIISNKELKDYIVKHTGMVPTSTLLKCIRNPQKLSSMSEKQMDRIISDSRILREYTSGILDGPPELAMISRFLIVLEETVSH